MSTDKYLFGSYQELVARALAPSEMSDEDRSSRTRGDSEWSGGSWKNAIETAQKGDMQGAKRLAPAILDGATEMILNTTRYDPVFKIDEGRWVDVARYLNGEPESWVDFEPSEKMPRKGLALILNATYSWDVDSEDIDKLGIELASLVLGLQALGHSVLVYYATKNGEPWGGDHNILVSAPLNPGATPLDTTILSAVLRPWFFRRVMFSIWETMDTETRRKHNVPGGYGRVADLKATDCKAIAQDVPYVSLDLSKYVADPKSIKKVIEKALSKQEVPANGNG